jgi:formate/nitrite transporter FocA (FNT family)
MAYTLVTGELSLSDALLGFFIPVLMGNVVGGTLIFAFLASAQVSDEIPDDT